MIHVFHTPTGWKVCQEYPEKPDFEKYNKDHFLFYGPWKRYEAAVALSIANAVDVREEDEEFIWKWFNDNKPFQETDLLKAIVYSLPELEMEIEVVETKVWFLEHVMSRAWVIQNNIAGFTWTNIPTEATQFSSSEEAQQYDDKSTQNGKELNAYPTEHIFYSKLAHVFRKKEEPKIKELFPLSEIDQALKQDRLLYGHSYEWRKPNERIRIPPSELIIHRPITVQSPPPDIEENQEELWRELEYDLFGPLGGGMTKSEAKIVKSKFHLTRVKAELKGEKK